MLNVNSFVRYLHHVRSIPASAGEPEWITCKWRSFKVYPRECGGTHLEQEWREYQLGLSPRVRGNQGEKQINELLDRSIPASAGEPHRMGSKRSHNKVYPRECGGTVDTKGHPINDVALSPRVRGNRTNPSSASKIIGSIPASAGEPLLPQTTIYPQKVYPRECGGTCGMLSGKRLVWGLSPRVRGNL